MKTFTQHQTHCSKPSPPIGGFRGYFEAKFLVGILQNKKTSGAIYFLLTFFLLLPTHFATAQKTNLTVSGVQFTIMQNANIPVSVNGNLVVKQSAKTDSNGKIEYTDGEILNGGNLYVTDSLVNHCDKLFMKTSNPYLTNDTTGAVAKDATKQSAGTVIFNGSSVQPINSAISNTIVFHNLSIKNPKGVKLNDSIYALGKVSMDTGSLFLNGKNLYLYYVKDKLFKYDGSLGRENNDNKVWDTTKVGHFNLLPHEQRSGHIVANYQNKPSFDEKAATLGLTINATSLQTDTIQRGHLILPYAGNGSIRKYFVIKTNSDIKPFPNTYNITYLDSSDYKNLHIKEPDFRLFLNQGNSAVTYSQTVGAIDMPNHAVSGAAILSISRSYVLTVADSACDNPPKAKLKANANVCQGVPFMVTVDSLVRTYSQMVFHTWYKNGVLLSDTSRQITDVFNTLAPDTATYKVKIYDNRGCFSYSTIKVNGRPIPEPYFKADDGKVGYCLGAITTLTDTSNIVDNTTLKRHWYWNDGISATPDTAKVVSHTYKASGTDTITMISSSRYGCSDTVRKAIKIHPLPNVLFSARNFCGDSSLYVKFINRTTMADPTDGINIAKWTFGANDTVYLPQPAAHLFGSTGLKKVTLTILSSKNCVASYTDSVTVNSKQTISFEAPSVCLHNYTVFQNNSSSGSATPVYTWDFGDSTFSAVPIPSKKYEADGEYDVTLHMQSGNCTDSLTKTIRVYPLPTADIIAGNACTGVNIVFKPGKVSQTNTYNWNIAGIVTQVVKPALSFNTAGTYDDTLTVISSFGCKAISFAKFDVYPRPKAEFTFLDVCLHDSVQFYNQSAVLGGSLTYQWSFEDDNLTSATNPAFTFTGNAGGKSVQLIATSNQGCSDTLVKTVQVYPLPVSGMHRDISWCEDMYILDATVQDPSITVSSYVWDNGTRLPNRTVDKSGAYSVDITSDKGCHVKDSVNVTLGAKVDPGLPDTQPFCGSGTLDATYPSSICTWYKNGSEIATNRYLTVSESGLYKVIINDKDCSGSDSVYVTVNPVPQVSLGNDVNGCTGASLILNAGAGFSTYHWSTGETTPAITVNSPARYKVTVTNAGGCSNADTINVSYLPVPEKPFRAAITQCTNAIIDAGDNASSYFWSTGATSSSISINASGDYWVKISNGNQCFTYDTVNVTILHVDQANLGSDISLCEGKQATLNAGNHDAGYTYFWNKQTSSSSTYQATKTGRYILELLNTTNDCSSYDTVFVQFKSAPHVNLGNDKALCNALSVGLDAGNPGALIQWGSSVGSVSTQQTFEVKEAGKYWVTVMNENGCMASDTIQVYPSSANLVAEFIAASKGIYTGDTVNFRDMSSPEPYTCAWLFGDGGQSDQTNPSHIFYIADTFRVTLTVSNNYCTSTVSKPITVNLSTKKGTIGGLNSNEHLIEILSSNLYPNPTSGEFKFEIKLSDYSDMMIAIFDLRGSLVSMEKLKNINELTKDYSLGRLKPGIYIFKATIGKNAATYKIVKF